MIDVTRTADLVAPDLLGCVVTLHGVSVRLTEVEAYLGAEDEAAHTYRGLTPRNATMFGPPGRLYVYLSYGIHLAGNIVCAPEGVGQGCLMRAGEVVGGLDTAYRRRGDVPFERLASGPGNLGRTLGLSLEDNGIEVTLEPPAEPVEWVAGPRIGISRNVDAPLRFWIPGDRTVSRRRGRP
ncbi:MAG: DNA-3-methyladenine glycosylase [Corynebacterium humireducens]|jgi:DNA-3-methyladenine glycosylase|uniref:Putative 3-methyladenine DNA glycosylase n=2 Tax=Corynebacterium humireducens TaxID=1223514 RepID=A0A0B5D824_9CORY|nr:DNA-3-methyladenine glycosylase [Corynebacterium humireducens]AJE31939.1 3-methyladenine DNA glycosylase [Corynebacterium humireducens NBRC 106098 = DSM 45392]NLA55191.1 DNA-3-methyladenine glycosylase [Corynebacterium humireducens]NLE97472.1 DNA-3-methyladenine glycosylase [Propionibacterium sp.]